MIATRRHPDESWPDGHADRARSKREALGAGPDGTLYVAAYLSPFARVNEHERVTYGYSVWSETNVYGDEEAMVGGCRDFVPTDGEGLGECADRAEAYLEAKFAGERAKVAVYIKEMFRQHEQSDNTFKLELGTLWPTAPVRRAMTATEDRQELIADAVAELSA